MRYFEINTLGDDQDESLAFLDQGLRDFPDEGRLASGEPVGAGYPADPRIYLQIESPGLRLSSVLGNTAGYLILCTPMKEILERSRTGAIEILPFALYDHRQRLFSRDYWIVNPLGTVDCVNRQESDIEYLDDDPGQIVSVDRFVFDSRKLAQAPDIFRVPEDRFRYFVSENLPAAWHGKGFTNLYLDEVEVLP